MKTIERLMLVLLGITAVAWCAESEPPHTQQRIYVKGRAIDIIPAQPYKPVKGSRKEIFLAWLWSEDVHWPVKLPPQLEGKWVATFRYYPNPVGDEDSDAYDTRTDQVVESLKADQPGELHIAIPSPSAANGDWLKEGGDAHFDLINGNRYFFYKHPYPKANEWVNMPTWPGAGRNTPPMVIGEKDHLFFTNPLTLPGTMIAQGGRVTNPSMVILDNGHYLAQCTGSGAGDGISVFKSTDRGVTWIPMPPAQFDINRQNLFVHRGQVYLLGMARSTKYKGAGIIYKSTDNGETWSKPALLPFEVSGAPSHVDEAHGRIWRAAERYQGAGRKIAVGVISAPVDADLMDPSSWTYADVPCENDLGNEATSLLTREGQVGVAAKAGSKGGAFVLAVNEKQCTFDPKTGFLGLPGAGSKYTIRYDKISDRYWALTSNGPRRCKLYLYSSKNLTGDWRLEKKVLEGPSSRFHGFNYPHMVIDGDDIVFVSRTAFETTRGFYPSTRWHDANLFTFHRIEKFRKIERNEEDTRKNVVPAGDDGDD